ncbi:MAG: hypothetical protein ABI574_08940 [Burkholderiales bacterium]
MDDVTPATAFRPLVLLPACHTELHGEAVHYAGQAYTRALRQVGLTPLLVAGVETAYSDAS